MSLHSSTSKLCRTGNATSRPSKRVGEMLRNCLSAFFLLITLLILVNANAVECLLAPEIEDDG